MAAFLAPSVGSMTGVDPDPWDNWTQLCIDNPNLSLKTAVFDDAACPLPAESINVVVCNQVYEHVSSPPGMLTNIARVLVPGGVCYFAGPNLFWPVEPHVYWPLVHWLPRRLARRVMTILGSRRAEDLDAFSAHSLKLRRWFAMQGFEVRSAIRERIVVGLRQRGFSGLAAAINAVPSVVFVAVEPVVPGFVFILVKAPHHPSNSVGGPSARSDLRYD
jgi:SAM-dependent methyltransferase